MPAWRESGFFTLFGGPKSVLIGGPDHPASAAAPQTDAPNFGRASSADAIDGLPMTLDTASDKNLRVVFSPTF